VGLAEYQIPVKDSSRIKLKVCDWRCARSSYSMSWHKRRGCV